MAETTAEQPLEELDIDSYTTESDVPVEGEYTSEDAVSDMAKMWKRAAAGVATAVELTVRAAGMTGSDDPPDPGPGARP